MLDAAGSLLTVKDLAETCADLDELERRTRYRNPCNEISLDPRLKLAILIEPASLSMSVAVCRVMTSSAELVYAHVHDVDEVSTRAKTR